MRDFRYCKHSRLTTTFRCVRCKVEVVLFRFWSLGENARRNGCSLADNPMKHNPHAFYSWQCGWEDGQ